MNSFPRSLVLAVLFVGLLPTPIALAAPCTDAQITRILAPARVAPDGTVDGEALVDCDLDLSPVWVAAISRILVFQGAASSGVTLDCNGGTLSPEPAFELYAAHGVSIRDSIDIRSRRLGTESISGVRMYEPPVGVTIRDCEVRGSIRIFGMGRNVNNTEAQTSSRAPGHLGRIQAAAPRNTTLDNVTIVGFARGPDNVARSPLYISGGVRDTLVTHSHVTGITDAAAVYLEAESTRSTFRNNTIDAAWSGRSGTRSRELISVDGSSYNRFIGNLLSSLESGGLYLYRNCGEFGTVRITTPSHNEIVNNIFYYGVYDGDSAAVLVGARDGDASYNGVDPDYCHLDAGFGWGSSISDRDHATGNVVMQNQVYRRAVVDVLRTGPGADAPNYISRNSTVTESTVVSRAAGCYTELGYTSDFLTHGASTSLLRDHRGIPYCSGIEVGCSDGDLVYTLSDDACELQQVAFQCQMSNSDGGCSGTAQCPSSRLMMGAHAACNLESGSVTDTQLNAVPGDTIRVVRASDVPSDGSCWVARRTVQSGDLGIARSLGVASNAFGCRERDSNGGDCHIRGVAYCWWPF